MSPPAARAPTSKTRRREDVVASYWQRYCAKNDTIGFYGPLAWGRIDDAPAPALQAHSGPLIRERSVHLESWGVQTLARILDPELRVPLGPRSEDDLRLRLEHHPDRALRARGLDALAVLEAAREALARADRRRAAGRARRARRGVRAAHRRRADSQPRPCVRRAHAGVRRLHARPRRHARPRPPGRDRTGAGGDLRSRALVLRPHPGDRRGRHRGSAAGPERPLPFAAILPRILVPLMRLPPAIDAEVAELQRRMTVAARGSRQLDARAARAATFGDHSRAWPFAVYQSVDVQVAARDVQAIADGDYLAVIGDIHPGSNPLLQGLFGNRHPDPATMYELLRYEAGAEQPFLLPPWGPGMQVDARGVPLLRRRRDPHRDQPGVERPGSGGGRGGPTSCGSRVVTSSMPLASCASRSSTSSRC